MKIHETNNRLLFDTNRPASKTMDVQISDVHMADYQREIDRSKVKRICAEFMPDRMRPIELSLRDGKYWCYDGQNRLEVCKLLNMKKIKANVHYGLTYEDEAFLFAVQHINERYISKREQWDALIKAGDRAPLAKMVNSVCLKWDFVVGSDKKDGKSIGAVREILKIAERHGKRGLDDILFVLRTAFENDPYCSHHDLVAGMGRVLDLYKDLGDFEFNRFVQVLSKQSPRIILKKAMTERGRGGKQVARIIVREFNKGLGKDSKKRLNENLIH